LLAVRCIAWLDLLWVGAVLVVLGKATLSATALEEEENDQEPPKMPKEPMMAPRTFEERQLTGGDRPDKECKEHADEKLRREHRNAEPCISDSDDQKHNEPERKKYAPHA